LLRYGGISDAAAFTPLGPSIQAHSRVVVTVTTLLLDSGGGPEAGVKVAETVVCPGPVVVANPLEPAALLICATAALDEAQVDCVVTF
jgi:hypothetical protein